MTSTTTTVQTTTTTKPVLPTPIVIELGTKGTVNDKFVGLKLRCANANCVGVLSLTDVRTGIGARSYALRAGKAVTFAVRLNHKGKSLMAGSKGHSIKVTETVTVNGGKTVTKKITLSS